MAKKNATEYVPRLTIELRQDQIDDLRNLVDWGMRSKLIEPVFDDLIAMLKKDRIAVTNLLLTRSIQLKQFLKEPDHGES